LNDLLQRLRERKLVQWALAYVAAAFALIQVADVVGQQFGWPEGVRRGITIALAVGFFVTLVLAWYHGERGAQRVTSTELLILALLLTIGGGLLWRVASVAPASPDRSTEANRPSAPATPVVAKSIAVLPFENLSDEKGNAYFADGMRDEILTRLAGIAELKVISRTSTERYQSRPENLREVGAELGVATLLEGSVQKSGEAVRVNVQLIDARTDAHLWAQTYDRELNNVFGVESEVAQRIADVLKARLSPQETNSLARAPTQNAAAYDAFLKAESLAHNARDTLVVVDYLAADAAYQQAIALDPGFALAYARLAYCQIQRHWYAKHLSAMELVDAKATADRALALAPDLPEAHVALGYYAYWGFRRYSEAVAQFQRTLQLAPNNLDALTGLAFIARRRDQWEQALEFFQQVLSIAPRDVNALGEYGITYAILRRYPEAVQQLSRALAIDPMDSNTRESLMRTYLFGLGDVRSARAANDPPLDWRIFRVNLFAGDVFWLINPRVYPDLFDRRFDAALHDWDAAPVMTDEERLSGRAARVAIQVIAGRQTAIRHDCEQLKPLVDTEVANNPESLSALQQVSWVDVCLGRNADAIAAARRATEILPVTKDAYFGEFQLEGLAEIEAHAGTPDDALKLIEQLLAMPAGESMSVARLQHDPVWDLLRKDPRFQALLAAHPNDAKAAHP
jgi:TolB-like protein